MNKNKIIRWIRNLLLAPIVLVMVYFLAAGIGTLLPSSFSDTDHQGGIPIYVRSNGVHTDLVVPIISEEYDWRTFLSLEHFQDPDARYYSFGWGDKGFYLHTPEWKDLKFSTAFKAAFWMSTSAMHVTTRKSVSVSENCKAITISKEQYRLLVEYIQNRFQKNAENRLMPISGYHYSGSDDCFFDAHGTYSFLQTCNSWANGALKIMNVRTATWAPFDWCIFFWR